MAGVDGIPQLQVTMVGNTGSGKTTYLVGMYAALSLGVDNYFLTSDQDTHVDLTGAWDLLLDDGVLPQATSESKTLSFMFRHGTRALLGLEWIDYRGGATVAKTDDPATVELLGRLGASDSVYLTFDGAMLASILRGESRADRRLTATISQYNGMIANVLDERRKQNLVSPSIVLLVTKSDLLIEHLEGDAAERRQKVVDWITDYFSHLISEDCDVAACLVSLGDLGAESLERVDATRVDPLRVHKPMVFTLFAFYRRAAMMFEEHATAVRAQGERESRELMAAQSGTFGRVLGRKRATEITEELRRSHAAVETFDRLAGECWDRVRVLEGELLDIHLFMGQPQFGAA